MFDEQPDGNPHGECAEEIARLRADLAASQAECERMREALMRVQNFPGHPGGHTADVSADADDSASWRHGWICAVEAMQEHAIPRQETE